MNKLNKQIGEIWLYEVLCEVNHQNLIHISINSQNIKAKNAIISHCKSRIDKLLQK